VGHQASARHIESLEVFVRAVGELLGPSNLETRSFSGDPTVVPRPGAAEQWRQKRAAVDRAAPAAARAFAEAGVGISWKPPGTWNTYSVNPAVEWSTILEESPKFSVDVLEAVCNQALGSLETGAYEVEARPFRTPREHQHLIPLLIATLSTAIGGLIVAYAAYRFGWIGG
jgi:hypothetical protein